MFTTTVVLHTMKIISSLGARFFEMQWPTLNLVHTPNNEPAYPGCEGGGHDLILKLQRILSRTTAPRNIKLARVLLRLMICAVLWFSS